MATVPPSSPEPDPRQLPEIATVSMKTARLKTCIHRITGREKCEPVVFVHGNTSSSAFFFPLMKRLPRRFRPIAVDLRGFGGSAADPVSAARGMRDFSDDVLAVCDALDLDRVHLVGWSLGGAVAIQAAIDAPDRISTLTAIAPVSPLGFGGLWDAAGDLVSHAGSGAGLVAAQVVDALRGGSPASTSGGPIRGMLEHLFTGPNWDRDRESVYLDAMFSTAVGDENFPGDVASSSQWPGFEPGTSGVLNAMAPAHANLAHLVDIDPKPPILWLRGDADKAISDTSSMDPVYRARKGAFGGVPDRAAPHSGVPASAAAVDAAPSQPELVPQPMVTQTRTVLDGYVTCGGSYREVVLPGVGHCPHLEDIPSVLESLIPHLDGASRE